jgi:hypothetical protein
MLQLCHGFVNRYGKIIQKIQNKGALLTDKVNIRKWV